MMTAVRSYHTNQPYIRITVHIVDGVEYHLVHPHSYQTWDCQPRYQSNFQLGLSSHSKLEDHDGLLKNSKDTIRRISQGYGHTPAE